MKMARENCKKRLHEKVCALWTRQEAQDASCFCSDGCDYFEATLTPPNEPLTLEQLQEMDGEPVWFDTIKRWGIVKVCQDGTFILTKSGEFEVGYITRRKYYRRPPEGET